MNGPFQVGRVEMSEEVSLDLQDLLSVLVEGTMAIEETGDPESPRKVTARNDEGLTLVVYEDADGFPGCCELEWEEAPNRVIGLASGHYWTPAALALTLARECRRLWHQQASPGVSYKR